MERYKGEPGKRVFDFVNSSWGWGIPIGWPPDIKKTDVKGPHGYFMREMKGFVFSSVEMTKGDFIIVRPNTSFLVFRILSAKREDNPRDAWSIVAESEGLFSIDQLKLWDHAELQHVFDTIE